MSNKQKSLVILTPGFAASKLDSTCLPMHQHFVRCLNQLHPALNVIILSLQYPFHTSNYKWFAATVICLNGQNKGGLAKLLLRQKAYSMLKKIRKQNELVGLLSFWYGECAYIAEKFRDKHGIRHFCWLLGQDAKKENTYPTRVPMEKEQLIALSDFLQEEFERNHGVRPARVIPHGNNFNTGLEQAGEREFDVLAAGSLIPLKQFDTFLEVIARIKKVIPKLKCSLAGNGPEKEKLEKMIARLGLQDCVTLLGELQHDSLLRLMQKSKIFVHPSSYEGLSGVCLEALSMGAHVISFTKPMRENIKQWHVVQSRDEMIKSSIDILQNANIVFERQVVFKMENTVKNITALYDASR